MKKEKEKERADEKGKKKEGGEKNESIGGEEEKAKNKNENKGQDDNRDSKDNSQPFNQPTGDIEESEGEEYERDLKDLNSREKVGEYLNY